MKRRVLGKKQQHLTTQSNPFAYEFIHTLFLADDLLCLHDGRVFSGGWVDLWLRLRLRLGLGLLVALVDHVGNDRVILGGRCLES